jgi:hypothetical protein
VAEGRRPFSRGYLGRQFLIDGVKLTNVSIALRIIALELTQWPALKALGGASLAVAGVVAVAAGGTLLFLQATSVRSLCVGDHGAAQSISALLSANRPRNSRKQIIWLVNEHWAGIEFGRTAW